MVPARPRSLRAPAWCFGPLPPLRPALARGAGWLLWASAPPLCGSPPGRFAPPARRPLVARAGPPSAGRLSPALWPPVGGAAVPFGWVVPFGWLCPFGLCVSVVPRPGVRGFTGAGRPCGLTPPCPCLCSGQKGPSSGPGATFGGPGSLRPGPCLSVVPWVPLALWPLPLCVYRTYVLNGVEKPVECVYNRNKCRGKE